MKPERDALAAEQKPKWDALAAEQKALAAEQGR